MKLYGKTLFLKRLLHLRRGVSLTILPTTKCNLHCDYCPMFLDSAKYPVFKESTFEEWKAFFEFYPKHEAPIFQIEVSGGEPTMYKDLLKLVNYLIDKGKHVVIYTNMYKPLELYKLKNSYRLRIKAVWHKKNNINALLFESNYHTLKKLGYDIQINEVELPLTFKESKLIHKFTPEEIRKFNAFHVSPDLSLFCGCDKLYNSGK